MNKKVRVRFAPSPTGPLHIGGVRTALYNYLFAKKNNGDFILRIEDTDQNRFVPGAEEYIVESLRWCGILPNEGIGFGEGQFSPYRQSERKKSYKQYAEQLISNGYAYYAFDTPEELEQMRERLKSSGNPSPQYNGAIREYMKNSLTLSVDEVESRIEKGEPYVVRVKIPRKEEVKINDLIRGWVVFHSTQLDDKVLFKSDGMPTYHMANVVDDYLMQITHVIRGEEWLSSAPLHILLYRYLGWEQDMPQFAHLPLILRPDGNGKLSKRDGDRLGFPVYPLQWKDPETKETSLGFRERGFFPEAVVNFLSLLGWNPGGNNEIFSMDELINLFSIEKIGKSGARFNFDKAKWFNQQYLKLQDSKILVNVLQKILKEKELDFSDEYIEKIIPVVKDRAIFLNDLWETGNYFFIAPEKYDEKAMKKWNEKTKHAIEFFILTISSLEEFNFLNMETSFQKMLSVFQLEVGALMPIFRAALTGSSVGPSVFQIAEILGKETTVNRLTKICKEQN